MTNLLIKLETTLKEHGHELKDIETVYAYKKYKFSVDKTLELLKGETNEADIYAADLEFVGKTFKVIVEHEIIDYNYGDIIEEFRFAYIDFEDKLEYIAVVPNSLSNLFNGLPYKSDEYLEKEKAAQREREKRLEKSLEEFKTKIKKETERFNSLEVSNNAYKTFIGGVFNNCGYIILPREVLDTLSITKNTYGENLKKVRSVIKNEEFRDAIDYIGFSNNLEIYVPLYSLVPSDYSTNNALEEEAKTVRENFKKHVIEEILPKGKLELTIGFSGDYIDLTAVFGTDDVREILEILLRDIQG